MLLFFLKPLGQKFIKQFNWIQDDYGEEDDDEGEYDDQKVTNRGVITDITIIKDIEAEYDSIKADQSDASKPVKQAEKLVLRRA